MAVTSLAVKVLVPVLLVGGGTTALLTAPAAQPRAAARLWIDSPLASARIEPGEVTVVAHAADGLDLSVMTLLVDGAEVARRTDFTSYHRLAGVQFTWNATNGYHFLVVRAGGIESAPVAVSVGDPAAPGTATATPAAKPTPSAKPSPTATPTTASSTAVATPTASPTRTSSPTRAPSPTAPPADPVITSVTISPNNVYAGDCTGPITVTAKVKSATGGSAHVVGNGVDKNIGGQVSGGTFTATFQQRDLTGNNVSGTFQVEVTVTNKTGFDVAAASVTIACSKD